MDPMEKVMIALFLFLALCVVGTVSYAMFETKTMTERGYVWVPEMKGHWELQKGERDYVWVPEMKGHWELQKGERDYVLVPEMKGHWELQKGESPK